MAVLQNQSSDAAASAPGPDPLEVLCRWFEEASQAGDPMPEAMTLATASPEGRPSARIVLFKGIMRGAIFFVTNYESRKARELELNPWAALVFHFPLRERQVRLEGRVQRATVAESDAYFASRANGSQVGAWASPQSKPVAGRTALEESVSEVTLRFAGASIPRPPFWGGYLVFPDTVELWLGRRDRLHDRFAYRRRPAEPESWDVERLAP